MDMKFRKILKEADAHHEDAAKLYRRIIDEAIKKSGSVAAAARQAGLVVTTIHEAIKRGSYLAIRNCAHKIAGTVKK